MLFAPRAASLSNKVAQLSLELKGSEEYTTVRITRMLCVLAPVVPELDVGSMLFRKEVFRKSGGIPRFFTLPCAWRAQG